MINLKKRLAENYFFILITVFAAIIRVAIASQNINYVDRLFVPDDTYYTLKISQSLASGLGPSYDGLTLTSGFQPLLAFLQIPFFWISNDPDTPLIMTIFLTGLLGSVVVLLVGLITSKLVNFRSGIIASVFTAISPLIISNDLNGLETSLTAVLILVSLFILFNSEEKESNRLLFILGIVSGLTILSRIDSVAITGMIFIYVVSKWKVREVIVILLGFLIVLLPWWIYTLIVFNTVIPESGVAVKSITNFNKESNLFIFIEPYYVSYLFALMNPVFVFIKKLSDNLILLISFGFFFSSQVLLFLKTKKEFRNIYLLMITSSILYLGFYVFYLPAFWFFDRYFNFVLLLYLIGFASLVDYLLRLRFKSIRIITIIILSATLFYYSYNSLLFFENPDKTPYTKLPGPKGYREIALDILNTIPEGSVIGAMQSGALNYYSNNRYKVLNLDGVVNRNAYDAIKNKQLALYCQQNKMEYFVDWKINVNMLLIFSGSDFINVELEPLVKLKKQGNAQFVLYRFIMN